MTGRLMHVDDSDRRRAHRLRQVSVVAAAILVFLGVTMPKAWAQG